MPHESLHIAHVDVWLKRAGKALSSDALVRLLEAALHALWMRTQTTLGVVTLTAIAERVLLNATLKFPSFSTLKLDPGGTGIQCEGLREQLSSVREAELREGIRFLLAEFLTVLGRLTAEVLTSELHSELSRVAVSREVGPHKATRSRPKRADSIDEDGRS